MPNDLVQINNTLSSTATDEALTAAQGKILDEKKVTGSVGATAPTSANFAENNAVYFQYNATNNSIIPQTWLNAIYPIGCYYWSSDPTNPSELFGGTWAPITDTFILAAGTTYPISTSGGTATHSHTTQGHTLTVSEIPSHNHTQAQHRHSMSGRHWSSGTGSEQAYVYQSNRALLANAYTDYQTPTINNTGGGGSHSHGDTGSSSNIPPYITAYCWHRTG